MTYPGPTTYPGSTTFPSSSDYAAGSIAVPYFTVGAWSNSGTDSDGNYWKFWRNTLTGWFEPPPAKGNTTDRVNANGSFNDPVFDDARTISWTGSVLSPDRVTMARAQARLAQVARALRDGADVIGHWEDGDYTVHAKRSGSWTVAELGWLGFQYQAFVRCPDPYKYGATITVTTGLPTEGGGLIFPLFDTSHTLDFGTPGRSGRVSLVNTGTTDATQLFTVNGPVYGGISITETASGRQIAFPDDIPAGAQLVIDAATGSVQLNGAERAGRLTLKQWWTVPAGATSIIQFATAGVPAQSGTLTVTMNPTFQ